MKKLNKKTGKQTSLLAAAVKIDEMDFLEELIKDLADRRYETGYCNQPVPQGWSAMDTSSLEAYVSGTIALADGDDHFAMPFVTCFMFTCTKVEDSGYDLSWISSLS
jgi:hypothetical protein